MIGQLMLPSDKVRVPSAMVCGSVSLAINSPARKDRAASFASNGSAPTISGQFTGFAAGFLEIGTRDQTAAADRNYDDIKIVLS